MSSSFVSLISCPLLVLCLNISLYFPYATHPSLLAFLLNSTYSETYCTVLSY